MFVSHNINAAIATFFFYNDRKPRKYGYTPILYNEEEEARKKKLEKRILEIKKEMGVIPEEPKKEPKVFKEEFISQTRHLRKRKEKELTGRGSFFSHNLILILIIALLFAIFYFWIIR